MRAEHGVSNPSANHTLLCSYQCREVGVIVDDCHKRHIKSADGTMGTQSICFKDNTTIDLRCKSALMTFETEKLDIQDYENDKYPIYDIASPDWNPRNHFDDPYGIDIHVNYTECSQKNTDKSIASTANSDIPSLLDNSIQQDEFDQISTIIGYSTSEKGDNDTLDNIKVPWDIETCYKENDDLSILSLMDINLENNDLGHPNTHER